MRTLTFLFTDIADSTQLWEAEEDAMSQAVAVHDQLVRRVIEEHSGDVFKMTGDGACSVFSSVSEAIEAAVALQLVVQSHDWSTSLPIRLKIALHTGESEERGGDYFGPTLNLVARLVALCQPGQVLLSSQTAQMLRNAEMVELGFVRLRGISAPVVVFQLGAENFAPIDGLNDPICKVPTLLSEFIARDEDADSVIELLEKDRLITLTGSGGCGKTRLAIEVAKRIATKFSGGVYFVDFSPMVRETDLRLGLSQAIGTRTESETKQFLLHAPCLLLFDNCEHLIDNAAALAVESLGVAPHTRILATSRENLGIDGEVLYRVPPMQSVEPEAATIESVKSASATQLFISRAKNSAPDWKLDEEGARLVSQICSRLDGIPLAIELASARLKTLSLSQILERLANRFELLTSGSRTAVPRQQTLRAAIDWSYDMLDSSEAEFIRNLAILPGSVSLETIEGIWQQSNALEIVSHLVEKSLVSVVSTETSFARYKLLETIREYCEAKNPHPELVYSQALQWATPYAEKMEPLIRGHDQQGALEKLDLDHHLFRSLLHYALDEENDVEMGLKLASALHWFWFVRGFGSEGIHWLELGLSKGCASQKTICKAENACGILTWQQGKLSESKRWFESALAHSRKLHDKERETGVLSNLGMLARDLGDFDGAKKRFLESVALFESLGMQDAVAKVNTNLAVLAMSQEDFASASERFEVAIEVFRKLDDQWSLAVALSNSGSVAFELGETVAALQRLRESVAIRMELQDRRGLAFSLVILCKHSEEREVSVSCVALCEAICDGIHATLPPKDSGLMEEFKANLSPQERFHLESLKSEYRAVVDDWSALRLKLTTLFWP